MKLEIQLSPGFTMSVPLWRVHELKKNNVVTTSIGESNRLYFAFLLLKDNHEEDYYHFDSGYVEHPDMYFSYQKHISQGNKYVIVSLVTYNKIAMDQAIDYFRSINNHGVNYRAVKSKETLIYADNTQSFLALSDLLQVYRGDDH